LHQKFRRVAHLVLNNKLFQQWCIPANAVVQNVDDLIRRPLQLVNMPICSPEIGPTAACTGSGNLGNKHYALCFQCLARMIEISTVIDGIGPLQSIPNASVIWFRPAIEKATPNRADKVFIHRC